MQISLSIFCLAGIVHTLPIPREVPQEHSHEKILTAVRNSLNLNNPDQILDPVFALLGNAAASQGLGKIADPDCLQQAVADQAFTNAKQAGDVDGQVAALIFRSLERNSGRVGLESAPCTSIKAVNPEIAAIQQHQDPASANAAATNKAITLELARQIDAVGGDPLDALNAGTFAPGDVNDPTGAGNTCDDPNDAEGCIFTLNLLVPDATEDEILAAIGDGNDSDSEDQPENDNTNNDNTANGNAGSNSEASGTPTAPSNDSNNQNQQSFAGALGGVTAPAVTRGGRGFVVDGSDDFLNIGAALTRSCDIQHNKCANVANSQAGKAAGLTVGQCDQQNNACRAAAQN